jgi:hypothetical protein
MGGSAVRTDLWRNDVTKNEKRLRGGRGELTSQREQLDHDGEREL